MVHRVQDLVSLIKTLTFLATIATTVITALVGWWAWVEDFGPFIVPIVAVTLVSGLYTINWARQFETSRGISEKVLKRTIIEWVMSNQWHVGERQEPNVFFTLDVTLSEASHCTIARLRTSPSMVVVGMGLKLSGHHKAIFDSFSDRQQSVFGRTVALQALTTGVEMEIAHPYDAIGFQIHIVYDAQFDKARLLEGIFLVRRATAFVNTFIGLALESTQQSEPGSNAPSPSSAAAP